MKTEIKVFLLGFVPFEKAAFESFFKLVSRRETLYKLVSDVGQAQVLIVSGGNPVAVQWTTASILPQQKVLFIGAPNPAGKWPVAPRPVKLATVLGLLEMLMLPTKADVQLQTSSVEFALEPALAPVNSPVAPAVLLTSFKTESVRQGSGIMSDSDHGAFDFLGLGSAPPAVLPAQQYDDILVVDDSDVALKFMQNRLTRYGFRAELAKSGEEALTRVAVKSYKFAFLDVMMEGLDGYQTCRAIKQRKHASGRAPIVVTSFRECRRC